MGHRMVNLGEKWGLPPWISRGDHFMLVGALGCTCLFIVCPILFLKRPFRRHRLSLRPELKFKGLHMGHVMVNLGVPPGASPPLELPGGAISC